MEERVVTNRDQRNRNINQQGEDSNLLRPSGDEQQNHSITSRTPLTEADLQAHVEASLRDDDYVTRPENCGEWVKFLKPAITLVLWTVINGCAETLISPQVPFLMSAYYDGDRKKAAQTSTAFDAGGALIAAFMVPYYGTLLDNVGRHPFFMCAAIFSTFPPALLYAIPRNPLWYLGACKVRDLFSTTYYIAYVMDHFEERDRARVWALGEGAANLCSLIALACPYMTFDTMVIASLVLTLTRLPFGAFFIKESLPKKQQKKLTVELLCSRNPLTIAKPLVANKVMVGVLVIIISILTSSAATQDISTYYLQGKVHFTVNDNYYTTVEVGVLTPFVLLIMYPILTKYVRPARLVVFCFVSLIAGLIALILVRHVWQNFSFTVPLSCFSAMAFPTLISIYANAGEQSNQGLRMAGLTATMDLMNALMPFIIGQVFAHIPTSEEYIPFLVCIAVSLPGLFLATCFLQKWITKDRWEVMSRASAASVAEEGSVREDIQSVEGEDD